MTASATAVVTKPVKKDSVPEIIAASMVITPEILRKLVEGLR